MLPVSGLESKVPIRAERRSLADYLLGTLTVAERARIGLLSFNQWYWTTAALVEVAVASHSVGSNIYVAWWSDRTPLHDPGWRFSQGISRLLRTESMEASAQRLIQAAGVRPTAFVNPPISDHSPDEIPSLPSPLTRRSIRSLTYRGSAMGRSILQVHPDFNTPIRDDFIWPRCWVKRAVESYAWVFDQTTALIQERQLTTIVVFNGRFTHDRAAAAAADALGVKVLYYDTGGLDTPFDLTDHTTHDWDALQHRMLALWDEWGDDRLDIAHAWFVNRESHTEPGIEVFIGIQQAQHLPELPREKNLVVFFSSSGDEMAEMDLDWTQYFGSQEQAVRTLAQVCSELPDTVLVVRTHPHMRLKPADDLQRWIESVEEIGDVIHIGPESPTDSYALMRVADRVVTYGSTSGIEAAYRGRPVAVMGPSAYQLIGCVTRVQSVDQLKEWLQADAWTSPELALPYGLMMQRRGFNYEYLTRDGSGKLRHGDITLEEPAPRAQKFSHLLNSLTTKWLTRK